MIAGRIDYFCPVVTIAVPQIESEKVTGVAILTKYRSPVLPELPSAHEQGLIDFAANTWFGIFLPRAAPAPIVQKLHDATIAAMDDPAVRASLKKIGADLVTPERRTPGYLRAFLEHDIDKWTTCR